jgi:16S rRNA (cytosine967-C5)-methyltransferase
MKLKNSRIAALHTLESCGACRAGRRNWYIQTCTTEPEENFEVVKTFRKLRPEFQPVDLTALLPFPVSEERDLAQLRKRGWQILPSSPMDGFLAKFKFV